MRYPLIVTSRRVFLAVLGIWLSACCSFIVIYVHVKSAGNGIRSFCYLLGSIYYFITCSTGYIPLIVIFFLNFKILSIARKQRKRILPAMMINGVNNSNEGSGDRMSFVFGFLGALKAAKTFAIVFAVLTFCSLIPTLVSQILIHFCSNVCLQIWYVVLKYELYGINSIVNVFIYGIRDVKFRKAYLRIFFKLFSFRKRTN